MVHILGKDVGQVGFGLMSLIWPGSSGLPDEEAIKTMKAALEAGTTFWNGGDFYGTPERNSLHLVKAYFTKYPEDVDRVVLSIKSGSGAHGPLDASRAGVRASVASCASVLEGVKKIDIYECARKDPNVDIEVTVAALAELVAEGAIGGIGLSEVGAETIRRAAKVHPIAAVEVEVSLWVTDILSNGVAVTCGELNIPIVAYSPLGRGFFAGKYKTFEDLPKIMHMFPRFQPGAFEHNMKLANEVEAVAKKKGCKVSQVAMAWVASLNNKPGMPPILPLPGTSSPERVKENSTFIELSAEELKELEDIVGRCDVVGDRFPGAFNALSWG